ncbi:hypothetical protein [Streptomyces viridochromogenes]|uniref:hypothetical protein n=1 Tax=Streptomyces viridochromogenes TaxID=1938 RepID=UPI00069E10BF|nr:hypothetical protein [Streptomyces viridochromogenes]
MTGPAVEAVVAPGRVETQVRSAEDGLEVLATVHPAAEPSRFDDPRILHLMAPPKVPYVSESASVVVADARNVSAEESFAILHDTVRQYPGAWIFGAVASSRSALVWVRVQPEAVWEPAGYTVRVTSTSPGPAELYASVIYGWAYWWLERLDVPDMPQLRLPRGLLLPRPPARLRAVHDEQQYTLEITDATFQDPRHYTKWRWHRELTASDGRPQDGTDGGWGD